MRKLLHFVMAVALLVGCSSATGPGEVSGRWGGREAFLDASGDSVSLFLSCAFGRFELPLRRDVAGEFAASGLFQALSGVNPPPDLVRPPVPATLRVQHLGNRLKLRVFIAGGEAGPFTVYRGRGDLVPRCL